MGLNVLGIGAVRWLLALSALVVSACATEGGIPPGQSDLPRYQVEPFWPRALPNNWILGQVSGVAVDGRDHVWILQRPDSLTEDERGALATPPLSKCCFPAPPVMEFDAAGRFLRGWGGPGAGYDWPKTEHGIAIDPEGNVWVTGNGPDDHQVLKFTRDGAFLLQIGRAGQTDGSNSRTLLGRPANLAFDMEKHEVFVADGYLNRRIVVFDMETGEYRRHWGAYGQMPADGPQKPYEAGITPAHFGNPVHCVRIARDGLVYVCDRTNDRIQVFRKDGSFVNEFAVAPQTLGNGSTWDIVFSPDRQQSYLYIADGRNNEIHVVQRNSGREVGAIGRPGRYAGQFHFVHCIAMDSVGNLYAGEVDSGKRIQKFRLLGPRER